MKPIKSFLFLLFLLLVLIAGKGLWNLVWEGDFGNPFESGVSNREVWNVQWNPEKIWGNRSSKHQSWSGEETDIIEAGIKIETEAFSIQDIWEQDTLMRFYREIYRLDADIFSDAGLKDIPLTPFEFDTASASRSLLDDFFVQLLKMRNPLYDGILDNWYCKPDFWEDELAHNRRLFTRILHFGDSQIEDDHITSTLRRFFQKDFGGSGPGLLPLFQPYHRLKPAVSGSWKTVKAEKNARKGNYGVYTANLTSPAVVGLLRGKKQDKGTVRYALPEGTVRQGCVLELILHTDVQLSHLKVSADGKPLDMPRVLESFVQKRYCYPLPVSTRKLEVEMNLSQKNRALYALALNDTCGVSVDNLPMRGSAGTVFTPNNRRFLTDQFNLLNTGLIIYQFGINALKTSGNKASGKSAGGGRTGTPDYNYYRMLLLQELSYIRSQMPSVPVVVVGVPDKPKSEDDLAVIRAVQKEVAFQTGCIYWDLYEAMGGENSMRRWAENSPALVGSDYIHLTETGADMVGRLFYKAFLDAYRDFLIRERKTSMMGRAKQLQAMENIAKN